MLNRARLFDPYEYGETFLDADMAIKQRQLPSPLDATHHIHLIDCDWEKISSFDDNIATIRKWVQVMVFGADESEVAAAVAPDDPAVIAAVNAAVAAAVVADDADAEDDDWGDADAAAAAAALSHGAFCGTAAGAARRSRIERWTWMG